MRRRDGRGHIDLPEPRETYRDLIGGVLCLDFANTVDNHHAQPTYDYLFPGYGNLVSWSLHADIIDDDMAASLMRLAHKEPREAVQVRRRAVALRKAIHLLSLGLTDESHLRSAGMRPGVPRYHEER